MADMWMPGAVKRSVGNTGAMTGGAAKATWHATSNINADGKSNAFELESNYFASGGKGSAPHLIWDPFTGQIAQYFPADSRALALRDAGSFRTNRSGKYNIQIEVVFAKGMTRDGKKYTYIAETPCKGLDKIMAWLKSLGIADTWPGGEPTGWTRDTVTQDMYHTKSGHYGHNQVPGNDHTDPGVMPCLFKTTSVGPKPTPVVEEKPVGDTYKVKSGDSLWGIAKKHGVTVSNLKSWNNLKSDVIDVDRVLKVKAPAASDTYTAKKGDTLWGIAKNSKMTVAALKTLNKLKSDALSVGQKLKLAASSIVPSAVKIEFDNVRYNATNNDIKELQKALNKNGAKLAVDGNYGNLTKAAVTAYQKKMKLVVDGVAGPQTLGKLGLKDKPSAPKAKVTRSNYETQPEPAHNYARVYWGGRLVNKRTAEMLDNAVSIYGRSFSLTQGSYNRGGVSASAGTHDGGGAVDINTNGHDVDKLQLALRKAGFASWQRTTAQGFDPHNHAIAIGDREASSGAKNQVQSYFNGRDGLAYNRADNSEHRWPTWCDKYNR